MKLGLLDLFMKLGIFYWSHIFPLFYGSQKYFSIVLWVSKLFWIWFAIFSGQNSFSGEFLKILKYINRGGWHQQLPLQTVSRDGWLYYPPLQTISRGRWPHHPPRKTIFRSGRWCHPPLKMVLLYEPGGFRTSSFFAEDEGRYRQAAETCRRPPPPARPSCPSARAAILLCPRCLHLKFQVWWEFDPDYVSSPIRVKTY